jgi:hypothetical protein
MCLVSRMIYDFNLNFSCLCVMKSKCLEDIVTEDIDVRLLGVQTSQVTGYFQPYQKRKSASDTALW